MKYFILAGEKSGDLHGSNLIKQIKKIDSNAIIKAWGGDGMKDEGAEILIHHSELSIMGIIGVLRNIKRLKGLFHLFTQNIQEFQPDTIIFIDYGGFNLKAAKIAKENGFHTQFYIAPKVWAWNKSRIKTIKKWIDELYVIFPFEEKLFQDAGISTHYVGNPLNDSIRQFVPNGGFVLDNDLDPNYIALLPGSRKQEVNVAMPIFKALQDQNPNLKFVVAGLNEYESLYHGFKVIYHQTYDVLNFSRCAVVTSGTATLETALLSIPQVVVYKTDWLFYTLAKLLIKIKYISLVNIILDKAAVPELIQSDFNSVAIKNQLDALIPDSTTRTNQLIHYSNLHQIIGDNTASQKAAELMCEFARNYCK
ncbi:lipid-A-disaccharide synthase [Aquirufa sp. ROCK2-A2]